MKNRIVLLVSVLFLIGCSSNNSGSGNDEALKLEVETLTKENKELKETIEALKYPASDRLSHLKTLISENKFDEARSEMGKLKELFPMSVEAKETDALSDIIRVKEDEFKAEEARIKALGFKALKEETTAQIGYNKISVGNFSIAQTFTYDSYDSRYFYNTADRGNKYISSRITITSSDKDPRLPVFWAYSVNGDKLELINNFVLKFARWEDYGTYLGNYSDNGNDFSKTATIAFKIGMETSDDILKNPIVILLGKTNCMSRSYERFKNPPVSYIDSGCDILKTLTIENVKENFVVVKILNRNKL